jgi:hypothetical protein
LNQRVAKGLVEGVGQLQWGKWGGVVAVVVAAEWDIRHEQVMSGLQLR